VKTAPGVSLALLLYKKEHRRALAALLTTLLGLESLQATEGKDEEPNYSNALYVTPLCTMRLDLILVKQALEAKKSAGGLVRSF
jgi:hypothetical protein